MNKYRVVVTFVIVDEFEIEANSFEEADVAVDSMTTYQLRHKCFSIPINSEFDNYWIIGPDGSSN